MSTTVADRVTVAGWVGSTNLGDELLFRVLRDLLADRGVAVDTPSVDPTGTAAVHDVEAFGHLSPSALRRNLVASDAFVFGPGGLLQNETGIWNLPYHLRRLRSVRRVGIPWAGIGLGADGLTTDRGRSRVGRALFGHTAIAVRDEPSAEALRALGVDRVVRAADLAFLVEPPTVTRDGVLGVCLRAPQSGRLRPGALDAGRTWPDERATALAAALDDTCRATGLTTRFVALNAPTDSVVHRQVADQMTTPAEVIEPDLDGVVGALARVDAVATMRYHGAVLAALGGAAVVALPHSPKLRSLVADLGPGATVHEGEADGLAAAVAGVLAGRSHLADAVDRLRTLAGRNVEVLDGLLGAA
ncbi:MAG: polysaccharide pyruvyl transferase family protein [Acidimicrobiales bacterium]|nr:polysaccharide pyruvyl transferase family protein [Acidimicrobiales bacterium]